MKKSFTVTYEIITEESAEFGDFAETGFVERDLSLREAVDHLFNTRGTYARITAIEGDCSDISQTRWVTVYHNQDWFNGEYENRSIHFPKNITPSSRKRLVDLLTFD
jgi:hypothetical protein